MLRERLRVAPLGLPLLLLAPRQATYQLERQLLADPELQGFTRLRVVSPDRLALELLEQSNPASSSVSEEGRVVVLRALVGRHARQLRVFHATARLPGFARQLSLTLRELQRHQLRPAQLRKEAGRDGVDAALAGKLLDCAFLLEAYLDWLMEHDLRDGDTVMDDATRLLETAAPGSICLGGLWLDGFAEMTPQELGLVAALVPRCTEATLAFCLPAESAGSDTGFGPWTVVGRTLGALVDRLKARLGVEVVLEPLAGDPAATRFAGSPVLEHLERHWADPVPLATREGMSLGPFPIRLVCCSHPEAEARLAAQEILAHVREGGRFRDVAVLVRSLDDHHAALRRVFRRYGIPFFLDRRESVAHHPLAELTRYALRVVAYGWRLEDWLGALKTGLVHPLAEEVDELENEARARGWSGGVWLAPLVIPGDPARAEVLERTRRQVVPAFVELGQALGALPGSGSPPQVTGRHLAAVLEEFWSVLDVPGQLERWAESEIRTASHDRPAQVHATVWQHLEDWVENVALAFADEPLGLRDWLPILESGLAGLTVGVVPPALDQVLVGAVDRSRNPNLEVALVLGVNERRFPAVPAASGLFTESDRQQLHMQGVWLGPEARTQLAHERFYGYIAFTRARRRLVVSYAERDSQDAPLSPSPFITHLQRLFPGLNPEPMPESAEWLKAVHPVELASRAVAGRLAPGLLAPGEVRDRLERLARYRPVDQLPEAWAVRLFGPVLRTSISGLERFGACPFQFFVLGGLRAEERKEFDIDARERGSFLHEVLARFQASLQAEGLRWRDLEPAEARRRVGRIGEQVTGELRDGLFLSGPDARLEARGLILALQEFVEATLAWMSAYGFDPVAVEVGFGREGDPLPPWSVDLGEGRRLDLRGRIDRVDMAEGAPSGTVYGVVVDYKSSEREWDDVLVSAGVQLQLPAYLGVVRDVAGLPGVPLGRSVVPVGAFYVGLRGTSSSSATRDDVLGEDEAARRQAYQYRGRFRRDLLGLLDARPGGIASGQFRYRLLHGERFHKSDRDPVEPGSFQAVLDGVRVTLIGAGRRILGGDIRVDPYQHKGRTPCTWCECRAICRIDPATHVYRVLTGSAGPEEDL
jgi:ATP-dependent helicase/nuclease subunit B